MTLWALCGEFIAEASLVRGMSKTTCKGYLAHVRRYCRWLEGIEAGGRGHRPPDATAVTLEAMTSESLKRFIRSGLERGQRPRTARGGVNALRAFGKWLVEGGHLAENPALVLKPPRLDAVDRTMVSDDDIDALLKATDRMPTTRRKALARAVLSVFVYCGLRRAECLSLRLGDVSLTDGWVHVRVGKGGKSRVVYPHPDCLAAVAAWLEERPACEDDWLFAYDTSRRLHQGGLKAILDGLRGLAGLTKRINTHDLRHSYARRQLRVGVDIYTVKTLLGHERLETTQMYLRAENDQLRAAAELGALRTAEENARRSRAKQEETKQAEARLEVVRASTAANVPEGGNHALWRRLRRCGPQRAA